MESRTMKWIIILSVVISIILAIILGIYAYNNGGVSQTEFENIQRLAVIEAEDNDIVYNEIVETSVTNTTISPNAVITMKEYFKRCDHLIKDTIDIPEDLVNKTQEDVESKYLDWKVEEYSPTQITLYKEENSICREHYVVKEHNGVIGIYTENNEGVLELKEDTEIETQYLPQEDLDNLMIGVRVVGKKNLIEFLEDYE